MKYIDLFSGVGGWALAAQQVWDDCECLGFCEIDPFCRQVLSKNFPGVPIYEDIRTLTTEDSPIAAYQGQVDICFASPPCQAASSAGRRKGKADDRWLWPQTFAVIQRVRPTYAILENVTGLLTLEHGLVFAELCSQLEAIGYEVQPFVIPAVALGAPHRRDRIWLTAHSLSAGVQPQRPQPPDQRGTTAASRRVSLRPPNGTQDSDQPDTAGGGGFSGWTEDWRDVARRTCIRRVDARLSQRLVRFPNGSTWPENRWRREALKAYGNAICVPVAVEFMRAIKAAGV